MGLTQAELAERAQISRKMVSALEIGTKRPSLSTLKRLATVLGCTLDELAGDYEEGQK